MGSAIEYHKAAKAVKMTELTCTFIDFPIGYTLPCRLFLYISLCCATSNSKGRP